MWTAIPATSSSISSHSPVWSPARILRSSSSAPAQIRSAQRIARAGPSNMLSEPSPVNFSDPDAPLRLASPPATGDALAGAVVREGLRVEDARLSSKRTDWPALDEFLHDAPAV
jgi:hypothetical protein